MTQNRTALRLLAGLALATGLVLGATAPSQAADTGWNGTKVMKQTADTGWNGTITSR